RESHVEIHAICGSHGCGSSIEIDGCAFRCHGTIEDGLGKRFSKAEAASKGAHPQAFHLPCIGNNLQGGRKGAPGDKARWDVIDKCHHAATTLLAITERQAGRFFLQRTEAEPSGARLSDDEASILKQQFPRSEESLVRRVIGKLLQPNCPGLCLLRSHARVYDGLKATWVVNLHTEANVCLNTSADRESSCCERPCG